MIRIALALAVIGPPAAAEPWTCQMTVRCQNVDCDAIDDTYGIIAADHEGQLFLTTPAGDRPVQRLSPQGHLPAAYAGASEAAIGELLTILDDGRALLSVHGHDGPARTTTLFGTCAPL